VTRSQPDFVRDLDREVEAVAQALEDEFGSRTGVPSWKAIAISALDAARSRPAGSGGDELSEEVGYLRRLAGTCGNHPACHSVPCIHSGLDALLAKLRGSGR
jgi:hypothetical protein